MALWGREVLSGKLRAPIITSSSVSETHPFRRMLDWAMYTAPGELLEELDGGFPWFVATSCVDGLFVGQRSEAHIISRL